MRRLSLHAAAVTRPHARTQSCSAPRCRVFQCRRRLRRPTRPRRFPPARPDLRPPYSPDYCAGAVLTTLTASCDPPPHLGIAIARLSAAGLIERQALTCRGSPRDVSRIAARQTRIAAGRAGIAARPAGPPTSRVSRITRGATAGVARPHERTAAARQTRPASPPRRAGDPQTLRSPGRQRSRRTSGLCGRAQARAPPAARDSPASRLRPRAHRPTKRATHAHPGLRPVLGAAGFARACSGVTRAADRGSPIAGPRAGAASPRAR